MFFFQIHAIDTTKITEITKNKVHPIDITKSNKSSKNNLSTPWTVESVTMCELDVFVGNYAIIDWEVYSLWLSGRSIAEAGLFKIFLCEVVMKYQSENP